MKRRNVMVGVGERISAYFRELAGGTARKLDRYITEHMPELIDTHRLATKNDFIEIDSAFSWAEGELDELDSWKETTEGRIKKARIRMDRLELKYGVEGK